MRAYNGKWYLKCKLHFGFKMGVGERERESEMKTFN